MLLANLEGWVYFSDFQRFCHLDVTSKLVPSIFPEKHSCIMSQASVTHHHILTTFLNIFSLLTENQYEYIMSTAQLVQVSGIGCQKVKESACRQHGRCMIYWGRLTRDQELLQEELSGDGLNR